MSNKKAQGSGNDTYTDEYGYQPSNPRHQESFWEGKVDPRFKDNCDKLMVHTNHYYSVIDRQIAADHHERVTGQKGSGSSTSGAQKK